MAEALLDGGGLRLLQRQRLCPAPALVVSFVSLISVLSFGGSRPTFAVRRAESPQAVPHSKIKRSARPPGLTAACITFSRPKAKPNSALVEAIDRSQLQASRMGRAVKFALAVGGAVRGLDQNTRRALARPARAAHCRSPTPARPTAAPCPDRPACGATSSLFDALGQIGVGVDSGLGGPGEMLLGHRLAQSGARCAVTQMPAARQFGRDIGNDLAVGPDDKTDQRDYRA